MSATMPKPARAAKKDAPPAMLDQRHGLRCVARKPDGKRCDFTARWVNAGGDPVCGFHTKPDQPTAVWPL